MKRFSLTTQPPTLTNMKTLSKILIVNLITVGLLTATSLSLAENPPGSKATNTNTKSSSRSAKDGIAQRGAPSSASPAHGGVRSAGPVQVAAPAVNRESAKKKLYWVGRASS